MKQFGGNVLYLENGDINSIDIPSTNGKVIISKGTFGTGSDNENGPKFLCDKGINTVIAASFDKSFKDKTTENNVLAIDIDKKSMADIFKTFGDKESEAKIILNEDGTAKVKLYAGSLSKSYPFTPDDNQKNLLSD